MADPNLSDALESLMNAQTACENATADLLEHNNDLESHPDIRAMLNALMESDAVYTREQIVEIISSNLNTHIDADPMVSHPKIASMIEELNNAVASIDTRLESVETWMNNGIEPGEETDLTALIQKVIDEYAPIIKPLRDALDQAITTGQTESAASLQDSLNKILDEQTEKIKEVIDNYRQEHTPSV